jgi:hypothetical protein
MKARQEFNYSHFKNVRVGGELTESGNGLDLNSAVASSAPAVSAIGDDTNVSLLLKAKTAGSEVNRAIFNGTKKTIVDGSATALFEVPLASGGVAAGFMVFAVHASDGTDHQVIAGIATYSGENKAGTLVGVLTYDTANEAKSVSAGTLTLSFTDDDNSDAVRFLVQPTGSLTETTYTITYTLFPLIGTVTIL